MWQPSDSFGATSLRKGRLKMFIQNSHCEGLDTCVSPAAISTEYIDKDLVI